LVYIGLINKKMIMEDNTEYLKLFKDLGLNVVPCHPKEKRPISNWKEYQDKKYTDEIESNIPLAIINGTTSGNLVVLDIDAPELINDIFSDFEGLKKSTIVIRSGGGGYHIWIKVEGFMPPTLRLTNKIGQHIDIQSQGTIVVAPPSVHKSGKPYEIISTSESIMTASIPAFLKKLETFGFEAEGKKKPIVEILKGVGEGERNDSAFRTCMLVRHLFKDVEGNEMLAVLRYWNEKNDPQMSTEELEVIVSSAMSYTIDDQKKWLLSPGDVLLIYGTKEFKDTIRLKTAARGKTRDQIFVYCSDCDKEIPSYPYNDYHKGHRIKV